MHLRSYSKSVRVVKDEHAKVVLDNDFVTEYLQNQNAADNRSDEINSVVVESSDDENDKSVVFVREEKPPEVSPATQCVKLRKENNQLQSRMRKIELNLAALQKRVREQINAPIEIDQPSENTAPIEIDEPSENEAPQSNDGGMELDDEWITNQIGQIQNEGNLTVLKLPNIWKTTNNFFFK